ncbi:riboflavin synthase domain-like protein [Hysterangium stoloniferum]|nr:riboflavin synthase domain-like protein [Hysterangium stoloniferum]
MVSTDDSESGRRILILYATETGNAYDVSQQISREAKRRHFKVTLASMDEYPIVDFVTESLVIFVVSTTGSGVEPRSMTPFWKMLLRSDLPSDLLEYMEYAVFGLGDTAYEKFCWAAKKLVRRLESLGAKEICPRGEGDEQHSFGLEGGLDPWIETLFATLLTLYPLPPEENVLPPGQLRTSRVSISPLEGPKHLPDLRLVKSPEKRQWATLNINKRITSPDWYQDVRHLEFDLDSEVEYQPGDIAVIYPEAPAEDVDEILIRMGWANEGDESLHIVAKPGGMPILLTWFWTINAYCILSSEQPLPPHVPPILTLRDIFTKYVDINAVPRRSFFDLLRHFADDDLEKGKLDEFCTLEGQEDLYDYCQRVRRTIREVIAEFRSVKVPREYIFDLFPPLRPRQFSIASSSKVHPSQIQLCVAIVQYKTKLKALRRGVCTTYLSSLPKGSRILIEFQKGLIQPPPDITTPIICVGPGTGIAPMRAMIEQRIYHGAEDNTLYFGCRSAVKDQHYRTEWEDRMRVGTLRYRLSCSRDGEEGKAKIYVQDLLEQDVESVWEILNNRKGYLYISGSSNKMPIAVKKAVEQSAISVGGLSEVQAQAFISRLEREARLFEECWS